jgi:hypothetical protein
LPQHGHNACFLGDGLYAFKRLTHKYRDCTLRICGLQRLIIGESRVVFSSLSIASIIDCTKIPTPSRNGALWESISNQHNFISDMA